jgi:hypothetical protein
MGGRPLTPYDSQHYQPPAPVAALNLRSLDGRDQTLTQVPAILDTGADITLLPRWAIDQLGLTPQMDEEVKLAWYDGSVRSVESVHVEMSFQGGHFQGRYGLIDQPHGIVGRNVLNHFQILFDGPQKTWRRVQTP